MFGGVKVEMFLSNGHNNQKMHDIPGIGLVRLVQYICILIRVSGQGGGGGGATEVKNPSIRLNDTSMFIYFPDL